VLTPPRTGASRWARRPLDLSVLAASEADTRSVLERAGYDSVFTAPY